jgi:integrase
MKKRHFGTIRRLPSGRWQVRFRDPSGLLRSASDTFASKADAARWLTLAEGDLLKGQWYDPALGQVSLAEWAQRWLTARPDLKPKTRAGYQSLLRSRILPCFGHREIATLRPLDIQEWIAGLDVDGLSPSRTRQATHLLGAIMTAAVTDGLVVANPCQKAKLPRMPQHEMAFLDAAEVERLAAIDDRYQALVFVLAYGGLRFGEAAALRRSSCDLLRNRLLIKESLAEVSGTLYFGATKTHQQRTIAIPGFLTEMLAVYLAEGTQAGSDPLVFTSPHDHPLRYRNFIDRVWRPALAAADLPPVGVHVLRHTCASLLIARGAPIKAIQSQLGHASAELTLSRYGHLYPDDLDALAARLDDARAAVKRDSTRSDVARVWHDDKSKGG